MGRGTYCSLCRGVDQHSFNSEIQQCSVSELIDNIKECLPDKDTGIIAAFGIFDPLQLPLASDDATKKHYGEEQIRHLGGHYGIGDSPPINRDDLLTEWFALRVYMIHNCQSNSMKEMLPLLARPDSGRNVATDTTTKTSNMLYRNM